LSDVTPIIILNFQSTRNVYKHITLNMNPIKNRESIRNQSTNGNLHFKILIMVTKRKLKETEQIIHPGGLCG